ncbi:MAG: hypothetical protein KKA73_03550 [Chloroflexi bacterium]|nr:hypothetical protein [Chloroflexota bacterium]MBU1746739.1 hypothetical protein [Chloroflexota bacterium]
MHHLEKSTIKLVAKFAPWLAPVPSAFFVARASLAHLDLPLAVAVVVAVIVETLGLTTVHTALWLSDWNHHKRQSDPDAPTALAVALGLVYVVTTVGLTVVLEVAPELSLVAPALFPALAVVGAVNLALISQQERREVQVAASKAERQVSRTGSKKRIPTIQQPVQRDVQEPTSQSSRGVQKRLHHGVLDAAHRSRRQRKAALLDAMVDVYRDSPEIGPTDLAGRLGIGRSTVYNYQADLVAAGRLARDDGRVIVLPGE